MTRTNRCALIPPIALECLLCGGDAPDPRTGFCGSCDARLTATLQAMEAEQQANEAAGLPPFA